MQFGFQVRIAGQRGMLYVEAVSCGVLFKQTAKIVLSSRDLTHMRLRLGAAQKPLKHGETQPFLSQWCSFWWGGGQFDVASVCSNIVFINTLKGKNYDVMFFANQGFADKGRGKSMWQFRFFCKTGPYFDVGAWLMLQTLDCSKCPF